MWCRSDHSLLVFARDDDMPSNDDTTNETARLTDSHTLFNFGSTHSRKLPPHIHTHKAPNTEQRASQINRMPA